MSGPGGASAVRLSKIDDYLADKLCVLMLSEVMGGVQGESGWSAELIPKLGMAPTLPANPVEEDRNLVVSRSEDQRRRFGASPGYPSTEGSTSGGSSPKFTSLKCIARRDTLYIDARRCTASRSKD